SPVVRLYLASGLQRMPPAQCWGVLEGLAAHAEDAADHNLPLMDWYAAEPLAGQDPARAIDLAIRSRVPLLPFMVRRIGSLGTPEAIALVVSQLSKGDEALHLTVLRSLNEALK